MFGSTLNPGCLPIAGALAALAVTLTSCAGGQADKADPVASTTATLNGYWQSTVSNPLYVRVYFKYGTTTEYGSRAFAAVQDVNGNCVVGSYDFSVCGSPVPGNTVHQYSAPVANLAPNTTYHFTFCANDTAPERDFCGSDRTFKTAP